MGQFGQPSAFADPPSPATRRIVRAVAAVLAVLFAIGIVSHAPGAPGAAGTVQTDLSRYKNRTLSRIDPRDAKRRWDAYRAIGGVFDRLWRQPAARTVVKSGEYPTLERFPLLQLEDRDGDGKAEFFAYLPPDGSDRTQEFGAFFDLDHDGRSDWIVFYGGVLFTKKMKSFVWHHHGIDTNGDGQFDIRVYGAIDMDGDGLPEENATAWLYDVDHDGLVDKAEHIIGGRVSAIEPDDGVLNLRDLLNTDLSRQPRVGGPMPTGLFKSVAEDVDALSRR